MKKFILTAPAKTFLFGEYAVLKGGPAVVVCTNPEFKLEITKLQSGECEGIHPQSPAGKWVRENQVFFRNFHMKFKDPYLEKKGGLGASTAQFLLLYQFHNLFIESQIQKSWQELSRNMLNTYLRLAWDGSGVAPSGADLLAQYNGGVCRVLPSHDSPIEIDCFNEWPFRGKDFMVVKTKSKLATHEHLENLKLNDTDELIGLSLKASLSLEQKNWSSLIQNINAYRVALEKANLTCEASLELLTKINSWPEVEACKACGAMGADTLVLLFDTTQKDNIGLKVTELGLTPIASKMNIGSGMQLFAGGDEMSSFGDVNV